MKKSILNGFTLIETIVVVAVVALTLPVIFAIVFTLVREQVKIFRLTEVKRNGDYLINSIENTIRNNAVKILSDKPANGGLEICNNINNIGGGSSLYFLDTNGQWFGYAYNVNVVSSSSATINLLSLTSAKTLVQNFSINCANNSIFSAPEVTLNFDICYDNTGSGDCSTTRPEEIAKIHYQSIVKIRNY